MTERHHAHDSRFARWREHRRAKRQQALERRYFEHEQARLAGSATTADDDSAAKAYAEAYPVDAMGPWAGMGRNVGGRGGKVGGGA